MDFAPDPIPSKASMMRRAREVIAWKKREERGSEARQGTRASWAPRLQYGRDVLATFQTRPGATFVVDGAAQADDAALATPSAEVKWGNGIAVAATFEGEFSETTT